MTERRAQDEQSHLFLVRVWARPDGGESRWQGRMQHVTRGDARHFDDWHTLIELFTTLLPATEQGQQRREE